VWVDVLDVVVKVLVPTKVTGVSVVVGGVVNIGVEVEEDGGGAVPVGVNPHCDAMPLRIFS
jgi:hypothetical protein